MTDKHVDELLADLDRALEVEPSPTVAARVRTRIAEQPETGWFGLNWRFVFVASGAVALVLVAGYLGWPRSGETPEATKIVASRPPAVPSASQEVAAAKLLPAEAPSGVPPGTRSRSARGVRAIPAADREPEVLISASQRLGLAQLAAAIRDGRPRAHSIPSDDAIGQFDAIEIPTVVIEPLKLDLIPGGGGSKDVR